LTREIFGTYPTDQKWAIINDEKAPKKYAQNKDPDLRKLEEEGIRDGLARLREGAETPPSWLQTVTFFRFERWPHLRVGLVPVSLRGIKFRGTRKYSL